MRVLMGDLIHNLMALCRLRNPKAPRQLVGLVEGLVRDRSELTCSEYYEFDVIQYMSHTVSHPQYVLYITRSFSDMRHIFLNAFKHRFEQVGVDIDLLTAEQQDSLLEPLRLVEFSSMKVKVFS